MNEAKAILRAIADLLEAGGEKSFEAYVRKALAGTDEDIETLLRSNAVWGGAGSVADQAMGPDRTARRRELERLLVDLGRLQLASGISNVRTEMWIGAFEQWHRSDI